MTTISLERKRALVDLPYGSVTLDGKPASILGSRQRFATVKAYNGSAYEWAWETAEKIVAAGGKFISD